MKARAILVFLVASALVSCAMPERRGSVRSALQENPSRSVPTCQGAEDCEARWSAARRWINARAGFRIQIYSADYMETYWSDVQGSRDLSVRVEREPLGAGRYAIRIAAGCRNRSGCSPDVLVAMREFDAAVAGVQVDPSAGAQASRRPADRPRPLPERPLPPPNF